VYQRIDRLDRVAFARGNLRGVDERRAVQTNIDEGGLHAGQHPYHLAFVDIADDATALRALDMHLLQHTVLHHRHPRFHGGDVHQDFFAHCCSRRWLDGQLWLRVLGDSNRPAGRSRKALA